MRARYIGKLREVSNNILTIGELTAQALKSAVEALAADDKEKARLLIDADEVINHKRFYVEEQLVNLIAKEQPMAKDLRNIVAHLVVTTELERTADYAVGIARNAYKMENVPPPDIMQQIEQMAETVIDRLNRGLQIYLSGDIISASKLGLEDDYVDEYYHRILRNLLEMVAKGKLVLADAMRLMWTAHNLERSADRTTNICERAIYAQTGLMKEFEHQV